MIQVKVGCSDAEFSSVSPYYKCESTELCQNNSNSFK